MNPRVTKDPIAPEMFEVHQCGENVWGIADLIGANEDQKE